MLLGGILFCAGALLNGFAQRVWMLIVGRMLLGFGIGCANQVFFFFFLENDHFINKVKYIVFTYFLLGCD